MRKGLAIKLAAVAFALTCDLAFAAPSPSPSHAIRIGGALSVSSTTSHSGIRPAVLEIPIPNSMHRALAHPTSTEELQNPAARAVQWLTGPVPSRCQHGNGAPQGAHACLVV